MFDIPVLLALIVLVALVFDFTNGAHDCANAIATAWVLRHPAKIQIVLGSMNPTRLGEMLDGADIDLDKQDWWDLYVAAGNLIP